MTKSDDFATFGRLLALLSILKAILVVFWPELHIYSRKSGSRSPYQTGLIRHFRHFLAVLESTLFSGRNYTRGKVRARTGLLAASGGQESQESDRIGPEGQESDGI